MPSLRAVRGDFCRATSMTNGSYGPFLSCATALENLINAAMRAHAETSVKMLD